MKLCVTTFKDITVDVYKPSRLKDLRQILNLKVRSEYLVWKSKDRVLSDDYALFEHAVKLRDPIILKLKISWKRNDEEEIHHDFLDFGSEISDLKAVIARTLGVSFSKQKVKPLQRKYLRTFLYEKDVIFVAYTEEGGLKSLKVIQKAKTLTLTIIVTEDKNAAHKGVKITVDSSCTVDGLRKIISDQLKSGICLKDICYGNEILMAGHIDSYGVKDQGVLTLTLREYPQEQFVLRIRYSMDTTVSEDLQPLLIGDFDTVASIKSLLAEEYDVNVKYLKLSFEGEQLNDDDVIRRLKIENGSLLTLDIDKDDGRVSEDITVMVRSRLQTDQDSQGQEVVVNRFCTVGSVTARLKEALAITYEGCAVSFKGGLLRPDRCLATYGVGDGDQLCLCYSLLVKHFTTTDDISSKVHRYPFVSEDTVADLKEKISMKVNIDARFIELHFNGDALEDEKTLEDSGVEDQSYLIMVSSLRGGQ